MAFEITKWAWEQFGQDLTLRAKEIWQEFNWPAAQEHYLKRVLEQNSTTRLLGYSKPIVFRDIYTDIHVYETPVATQWHDIEELQKYYVEMQHLPESQRKGAEGISLLHPRVLILGKPGSGKSTLLTHITLLACEGRLPKTPIFVVLREWADSEMKLMEFLVKIFEVCSFPDAESFLFRLFETDRALVLFDGLDEVSEDNNKRYKIISEINEFSNRYPMIQISITCRTAATEYGFEQFVRYEIADFNDQQINYFVGRWFRQNVGDDQRAISLHRSFRDLIGRPENQRFRELARTPLLLTFLCLAFEDNLSLPKRRVDLYKQAIDVLLKKWDTSRGIKRQDPYGLLPDDRKEKMLARIAAENFTSGDYLLRRSLLVNQINHYLGELPDRETFGLNGEKVLVSIEAQHGLIVERAQGICSFLHLTLQEYLTARYIVDNVIDGTLDHLVSNFLFDDRWREVILFTAGMLDRSNIFFALCAEKTSKLADQNPFCNSLINWSVDQSERINRPTGGVRAVFLFKILMGIFTNTLANELDIDFQQAYRFSYSFFTALTRELPRGLGDKLDYEMIRSFPISIARDIPFEIGPRLGAAFDRENTRLVARALTRSFSICLKLSRFNQKIEFPQHYALGEYRRVSRADLVILIDYLKANQLIIECLEVATVRSRNSVEDGLFC